MINGLIILVVVLILAGLALWVIQQLPLDATIMKIIRVIVIVVCVISAVVFLLDLTGVSTGLSFR